MTVYDARHLLEHINPNLNKSHKEDDLIGNYTLNSSISKYYISYSFQISCNS